MSKINFEKVKKDPTSGTVQANTIYFVKADGSQEAALLVSDSLGIKTYKVSGISKYDDLKNKPVANLADLKYERVAVTGPDGVIVSSDVAVADLAALTGLGNVKLTDLLANKLDKIITKKDFADLPLRSDNPDPSQLYWVANDKTIYVWDTIDRRYVEAVDGVAAKVSFVAKGNIIADNVQAAIEELDSEKLKKIVFKDKFTLFPKNSDLGDKPEQGVVYWSGLEKTGYLYLGDDADSKPVYVPLVRREASDISFKSTTDVTSATVQEAIVEIEKNKLNNLFVRDRISQFPGKSDGDIGLDPDPSTIYWSNAEKTAFRWIEDPVMASRSDYYPIVERKASVTSFDPKLKFLNTSTNVQAVVEELDATKLDVIHDFETYDLMISQSPLPERYSALYWAVDKQTTYLFNGSAYLPVYPATAASNITVTPVGDISSTTVQTALKEIDEEKMRKIILVSKKIDLPAITKPSEYDLYWVKEEESLFKYEITSGASAGAFISCGNEKATKIVFAPTGNLISTNVQAAVEELDKEKIKNILIYSTKSQFPDKNDVNVVDRPKKDDLYWAADTKTTYRWNVDANPANSSYMPLVDTSSGAVTFNPNYTGSQLSATMVQSAIEELDKEKLNTLVIKPLFSDLPTPGKDNDLYWVTGDKTAYRWNGSGYDTLVQADKIKFIPPSTMSASATTVDLAIKDLESTKQDKVVVISKLSKFSAEVSSPDEEVLYYTKDTRTLYKYFGGSLYPVVKAETLPIDAIPGMAASNVTVSDSIIELQNGKTWIVEKNSLAEINSSPQNSNIIYWSIGDRTAFRWDGVSKFSPLSTAINVPFDKKGNIEATNTQEAIEELDKEKLSYVVKNTVADIKDAAKTNRIANVIYVASDTGNSYRWDGAVSDFVPLLRASGVPFTKAGSIISTDVQTALEEVSNDKVEKIFFKKAPADVNYDSDFYAAGIDGSSTLKKSSVLLSDLPKKLEYVEVSILPTSGTNREDKVYVMADTGEAFRWSATAGWKPFYLKDTIPFLVGGKIPAIYLPGFANEVITLPTYAQPTVQIPGADWIDNPARPGYADVIYVAADNNKSYRFVSTVASAVDQVFDTTVDWDAAVAAAPTTYQVSGKVWKITKDATTLHTAYKKWDAALSAFVPVTTGNYVPMTSAITAATTSATAHGNSVGGSLNSDTNVQKALEILEDNKLSRIVISPVAPATTVVEKVLVNAPDGTIQQSALLKTQLEMLTDVAVSATGDKIQTQIDKKAPIIAPVFKTSASIELNSKIYSFLNESDIAAVATAGKLLRIEADASSNPILKATARDAKKLTTAVSVTMEGSIIGSIKAPDTTWDGSKALVITTSYAALTDKKAVMVTDKDGYPTTLSTVTSSQIGKLSDIDTTKTDGIQKQINDRAPIDSPVFTGVPKLTVGTKNHKLAYIDVDTGLLKPDEIMFSTLSTGIVQYIKAPDNKFSILTAGFVWSLDSVTSSPGTKSVVLLDRGAKTVVTTDINANTLHYFNTSKSLTETTLVANSVLVTNGNKDIVSSSTGILANLLLEEKGGTSTTSLLTLDNKDGKFTSYPLSANTLPYVSSATAIALASLTPHSVITVNGSSVLQATVTGTGKVLGTDTNGDLIGIDSKYLVAKTASVDTSSASTKSGILVLNAAKDAVITATPAIDYSSSSVVKQRTGGTSTVYDVTNNKYTLDTEFKSATLNEIANKQFSATGLLKLTVNTSNVVTAVDTASSKLLDRILISNTDLNARDDGFLAIKLDDGKNITAFGIKAAPAVPAPADEDPLVNGTATKGSSTKYAREDHIHSANIPVISVTTVGQSMTGSYVTSSTAVSISNTPVQLEKGFNVIIHNTSASDIVISGTSGLSIFVDNVPAATTAGAKIAPGSVAGVVCYDTGKIIVTGKGVTAA